MGNIYNDAYWYYNQYGVKCIYKTSGVSVLGTGSDLDDFDMFSPDGSHVYSDGDLPSNIRRVNNQNALLSSRNVYLNGSTETSISAPGAMYLQYLSSEPSGDWMLWGFLPNSADAIWTRTPDLENPGEFLDTFDGPWQLQDLINDDTITALNPLRMNSKGMIAATGMKGGVEKLLLLVPMGLESHRFGRVQHREPFASDVFPVKIPLAEQHDPERCPLIINDDNDDHDSIPATPYPEDKDDAVLGSTDDDVVLVTLQKFDVLEQGTLEFTTSSNADIRLYKYIQDQDVLTAIPSLPLTLDLANPNPQSPLADILTDEVSFYVEGLNANSNLELRLILKNASGVEMTRKTANIEIMDTRVIWLSAQSHGQLSETVVKNKLKTWFSGANIVRRDRDWLDEDADVMVPVTFRLSELFPKDDNSAHSSWRNASSADISDIFSYLSIQGDKQIYVVEDLYDNAGGIAGRGEGIMIIPLENSPKDVIAHEWLHAFGDIGHICIEEHLMVGNGQGEPSCDKERGSDVREAEKILFLNN